MDFSYDEFAFLFASMTASGLVGLVQPMLWDYTPELDVDKTGKYSPLCKKYDSNSGHKCAGFCRFWWTFFSCQVSLLEKYCSAGMSDLWAASSFKGSTCVYTCVPSTQRHVDNHLQWLKVAASLSAGINLKGITLTGWQRWVWGEICLPCLVCASLKLLEA